METGDTSTATTSLGFHDGHGRASAFDHAIFETPTARSFSSGAVESAEVDISELIGELQSMLSEALERQQENPRPAQLVPVGGSRWREVHSRLMSQAGGLPGPLERTSSQEVAELQEALQQSSSALRASQQQLQLLSARVEDLQGQLEAECERMVASVQEELQAAHDAHQDELRELQDRLLSQQDEAEAAAGTATAREAALEEALSEARALAQQAQLSAEADRATCHELQRRVAAYDDLWHRLRLELQQPCAANDAGTSFLDDCQLSGQGPPEEVLLAAARALQSRLREQAARGASAADAAAAAAAAAAADAAQWRTRAQAAADEAQRATLASEELRSSLGTALAALHEDAAGLTLTNATLVSELERRQSQVAELTATNTELEAKSLRLGAELGSIRGLRAALQAELLEAGGRHAALEAQVSELQHELSEARRRRDELMVDVSALQDEVRDDKGRMAARVDELQGELQGAQAREDAQRVEWEAARQRWQDELAAAREEARRESAAAAEHLAVALEEAADQVAATRRASERDVEQLRLQVTDLYERLGQARARGRAEAERLEEARRAERAQERAIRAALHEQIAAWASSALCARAVRAVERAGSADAALKEQGHAVRQTARLIFARVALCQAKSEADAAMAAAATRLALVESEHASSSAALAAVTSAEASRAREAQGLLDASDAQRLELQAKLSGTQRERDGLAAQVVEVQGRLRNSEAEAAALTARLEEALAAGAASTAQAAAAHMRVAEVKARLAQVQAQLTDAQQAHRDISNTLKDQKAAALAAQGALEARLAGAVAEAEALRGQVVGLELEREELSASLALVAADLQARAASVDSARADLQVQLAAAEATSQLLQQQHAAGEAQRQELAQRLDDVGSASQALERECSRLRGEAVELHGELDRVRSELEAATARLTAGLAEEERSRVELEAARAELGEVRAELERQCATHAAAVEEIKAQVLAQAAATAVPGQLPLSGKAHAKAAVAQLAAQTATSPVGQHQRAVLWAPGPLSHCVDVVGDADAEAEEGLGNAATLCSGALTVAAMGHVDDGARPAWDRCSADLPQYDQRYNHYASGQEAQRGTEAMHITTVLWPSTAAAGQRCSQDVRPPSPVLTSTSGCNGCSDPAHLMEPAACDRAGGVAGAASPSLVMPSAPAVRTATGSVADADEIARLRHEVSELRGLLDAERVASAARTITLRALRAAERCELQRQVEAACGFALQQQPLPVRAGPHGCCPWEGLWPSAGLESRVSAPAIGAGDSSAGLTATGDAPCPARRPSFEGLQRPRTALPGGQRAGLPPLPPQPEALPLYPAQPQQLHQPPHGLALQRWSSRNSVSSSGSHGSSSYWLPAAAAMAAAAGEYDAFHEPLWVTNAAFAGVSGGGGVGGAFGGGSSAAPSDSPAMDLADTIAALRAELAASQEALRKARSAGAASDDAGAGSLLSGRDSGSASNAPDSSHPVVAEALSPPVAEAVPSPGGRESLDHDLGCEAEGAARCVVVRAVVLRALRNVEREAMQRELADTRAARAAAASAASETRSRLSTLLAAHGRVCGEVEVLRAMRAELAAELGPTRCHVDRLRNQNEQLRSELRDAQAQRVADGVKAEEANARIAALESREAELSVRCDELTGRCAEFEERLRGAAAEVAAERGGEGVLAAGEREAQLVLQVSELRAEQAASAAVLDRLRAEYGAARQDRQRLQQQLVSLLSQTAAVQEAAAELCGSLRAAHADLDEQKVKLDEQRTEVARVQAESAAARQQLARARADGRQRAMETRAWARQALLLQEQLAVMAHGARTGLLPLSPLGDATSQPSNASTPSAGPGPAPALVTGRGSSARSPSPETSSAACSAAAPALLLGAGWAPAGRCSGGGAGLGRRCLSAIDLSSLAPHADEAAAAADLVRRYGPPRHHPQHGSIATQLMQPAHQQPPHPVQPPQQPHPEQEQAQAHAHHGLPACLMLRSGGAAAGASSLLSGLPVVNLHHLALLQGRGAWNPLAVGAVGSHMRHLARLRDCVTAGGAPVTATMEAAAAPEMPVRPQTLDGAPVAASAAPECRAAGDAATARDEGGATAAAASDAGAVAAAAIEQTAPEARVRALQTGSRGQLVHSAAPASPTAALVAAEDLAASPADGSAGGHAVGDHTAGGQTATAESADSTAAASEPSALQQQHALRLPGLDAGADGTTTASALHAAARPSPAPAPSPKPSPVTPSSVELLRWTLSSNGVSSRAVRQRTLGSTGPGHLRRLKEEEGEGEEGSGGREQVRADEDDSAWMEDGQQACEEGCSQQGEAEDVQGAGEESGGDEGGVQEDVEEEEEEAGGDGPAVGEDEEVNLIAGGFPRTLGRAASEADMHLFYNPMFSTGAGISAACPKSARAPDQLPRRSQDLTAVDGGRASAGSLLPATTGRTFAALSPGGGSPGGMARRLSMGPTNESPSGQLLKRLPLWRTSGPATPVASADAGGSGPTAPSSARLSDVGEQPATSPQTRANPVVKLYRKISRRLSSASREGREGL